MVTLEKKSIVMGRNTSVSLGSYFDAFIESRINEGRYKNASEVIRAGLRLLEEDENRITALRKAVQDGIDSEIVEDFDSDKHLELLKKQRFKE